MNNFPYRRIVVAGTSGCGKTTLAKALSERLDIPHIEIDRHFWNPGWVANSKEGLRERVAPLVEEDGWALDGNYSKLHDLTWSRAECVIWLDYPLPVILYRLLRRTLKNCLQKHELCNGNYESFRLQLFSRKSIFLWALQTHRSRRRKLLAGLERYPHLELIRFRSPRKAALFFKMLSI
jgi:adenylate kinase family enzyme